MDSYRTTYNKLSPNTARFLRRVENYIELPLYFYGSVQRVDFFPNKSDIDVDIFSPNESATIARIQSMLLIPFDQIKKMAHKLNSTSTLIYGHKISYKCPKYKMMFEFSIFNIKDRDAILKYHMSKTSIPAYISVLLVTLKFIFYNLRLISTSTFKSIKTMLMDRASSVSNNSTLIYI